MARSNRIALQGIVWGSVAMLLLLLIPGAAQAAEPVAAQAAEPQKEPPKLAAGYSYVTCYFGTPTDYEWKWGLAPNNSYYSMSGSWTVSQFSEIDRFVTTASASDVANACQNSKNYYGISGNLFAAFASASNAGDNYLILSNGTYLYPQY